MKRIHAHLAVVAALSLGSSIAAAQNYPDKPIHFILPFGAGSSTDALARVLATAVGEETGQTTIVENRPGAEGFIGVQAVRAAKPDGYTLLMSSNATHVLNAVLYKSLPYDPVKDFTPVASLGMIPLTLNVTINSPLTSVQMVIDTAKKQPGKLTFGSATAVQRLAGELFQQRTGIKMLNVPYKAAAASATDLVTGQIDMMFATATTFDPQVKAGRVRVLGVTTPTRLASMPNVPTIEQAGVPGYDFAAWFGIWLPAGGPAPIVNRLNTILAKAMQNKRVQNVLDIGGVVFKPMSPEAFGAYVVSEIDKFGKLVKAAGIEPT
jgi:tripartite-type tricarboxylate transporter receptor subunit TctC